MKKIILKTISAILIFILSTIALSSCSLLKDDIDNPYDGDNVHEDWDFYPEGYTAGFPKLMRKVGPRVEYWWVETYEECVEAIELLKSHGSTFKETAIFNYDGELFDTKYFFKISLENRYTEKIEFGDNPFDRTAMDVEVTSFAFLKSVTIEEINYGDILDYKANKIFNIADKAYENKNISFTTIQYEIGEKFKSFTVYDLNGKDFYFHVTGFDYQENPQNAIKCLETVLNSIVWINNNGLERK